MLQVFANFDPKNVTNFNPPTVRARFISARLFSVLQVENEVKRLHFADVAEIQEAVTDEGPKRGIFDSFSETVRPRRSLRIYHWSLF